MSFYKTFNIDVLDVEFKVGLYKDENALDKAIRKLYIKYNIKDEDDGIKPAGVVFTVKDYFRFYILFSKEHLTTQLISHEAHHLTKSITLTLGLSSKEDKEFLAILNGYINKVITKYIKQKGVKIG